jgi:mannose-1-phosphate guanylyltransferase/mannose-6-phosphate isomerase
MPTDHVISDTKKFHEVIKTGLKEIENGKIVTFGISPSCPETGYGYIQLDKSSSQGPSKVLKFIEKPDEILAKRMLDEGNYFWNSGIFMFRAQDMISAFELYADEIISNVAKSVDQSVEDLSFTKLDKSCWSILKEISIDYAIMEKAKNLVAIPYSSGWSDLGNWDSVWKESKQDDNGVVLSQNAHAIECKNTLLRSDSKNQQIVGLGLEDIVAISMQDAVLVANKNKSQNVKAVVEYLKSKNISQSEEFVKDCRPWGSFEILSEGLGFKVKKISVKPGSSLSLQSHKHRSEHWVVVEGSAVVTIDESIKVIGPGQSTYVPLGSIHRLENKEKEILIIIEIQIGNYLGEDDIMRYEDVYSRK